MNVGAAQETNTNVAHKEYQKQVADLNLDQPLHMHTPTHGTPHSVEGHTIESKNIIQPSEQVEPLKPSTDGPLAAINGDETKPKKILRLNTKTGTIGSPPSKKHAPLVEKTTRVTRQKQPPSKLVIARYGEGTHLPAEIGPKIGQILDGTATASSLAPKSLAPDPKPLSRKVAGANQGAAPHPFFLGKAALNAPAAQARVSPTPDDKASSRLKEPMASIFSGSAVPKKPLSTVRNSTPSGFGGFGGNSAKILKFPGAVEPAWPWKGITHVRGTNNLLAEPVLLSSPFLNLPPRDKKSKSHAVEVTADEDVIDALATDLRIPALVKSIREINLDEYPPLPDCLRTPTKHIMTGPKLQLQVQRELSTPLSSPNISKDESASEDELQRPGPKKASSHPALANIYNNLATSLSAFDQSQCETQSWAQKYAPKAAVEVLQTGREAAILKEWLQTLTVQSVETGSGDRSHSRASSVSRRAPGKRKQKSKKLDGFVVSSDEDDGDMDEITEPEDNATPRGSQGAKRTVVRTSNADTKGSGRLTNAVVVSGPHGCGKTAAVYAVAKELGFEIFEINSSSRRSGKDIFERVGDMTHNHLVQSAKSAQRETAPEPVDEDTKRIADALKSDIMSGRQGTMNSFFKPKDAAKPNAKPKKSDATASKTETTKTNAISKAPPKQQKQSLILFEEADILYEEDKQFWATVISMIVQSKRPIIITCTNESVIPLDALALHAIIRFTPPPVDLATDYMLLVAASEGHIIRREAAKTLYEGRCLDLRASLTELNFWCQIAIGDLKGGLGWYYARWPPGSDVDENGNTIRVVSENTYEPGMGWLSHDFLKSRMSPMDIEEEILHETQDGWHLDIGDDEGSLNQRSLWATKIHTQSKGKRDDIAALSIYADFVDTLSAADVCAGGGFAADNEVQLDASLPELSSKVRDDYILAHELIEASPLVSFDNTRKDVSLWMRSRARKYFHIDQHIAHGFEVPSELDRPSEAEIIELIKRERCSPSISLSRHDYSLAFDPIAEPEKTSLYSTGSLEASSFDRHFSLITVDIAPYVRSIAAYDNRLQQDRTRLSNLMSEGGRRGKRMRTTRSAMSALEGGVRSTTRKDRYFGPGLNPYLVLRTGMQSWLDAAAAALESKSIANESSEDAESGGVEDMEDKVDIEG
jgi:DNA polymerase III delta prime subunit